MHFFSSFAHQSSQARTKEIRRQKVLAAHQKPEDGLKDDEKKTYLHYHLSSLSRTRFVFFNDFFLSFLFEIIIKHYIICICTVRVFLSWINLRWKKWSAYTALDFIQIIYPSRLR